MRWCFNIKSEHQEFSRLDLLLLEALKNNWGNWENNQVPVGFSPTRSQIQSWIKVGAVKKSGKPIKANEKIREGSQIEIEIPELKTLNLKPENHDLDILYEDDAIAVINKPQGLTVHPSETQKEGTLVHALLHQISNLSGVGGVLRPGIVHRIDKDTSGALVITKTDEAHQNLAKIFSEHKIIRKYWAICYGDPNVSRNSEIKIESLIARNPKDRKKMSMDVKTGRKAITWIRLLENFGDKKIFASLIEARLETGRTHQVRVHLTGHGNSILGDPIYGTPSSRHTKFLALPNEIQNKVSELKGQMLHARVLGFDHPISGKPMLFEAPPPPAFQELMTLLQKYS